MAVTISPGMVVAPGDWDALFTQHGGIRPQADPANVSPRPNDPNYLPRDKQQPTYRYFLADGTTVDARTSPDGSGWEIVEYKPSSKYTQQARAEEKADAAPSPSQRRTEREEAEIAANAALPGPNPNGATEAERRGQDPRSETNAERQARADQTIAAQRAEAERVRKEQAEAARQSQQDQRQAAQDARTTARQDAQDARPQAVSTSPTEPYIVTMEDGKLVTRPNPNYKGPERPKPDVRQTTGGDGQVYTTVTSLDAEGRPTVQTFGPKGPVDAIPQKPESPYSDVKEDPNTPGKWWGLRKDGKGWEVLPGEGPGSPGTPRPGAQGPISMPHMVLGQLSSGLETYREQLLREVEAGVVTPATAKQRWSEVADISTMALQEANAVNSEEQSRRSADVSLRTNAMSNATSGFNSALSFIQHINDRLPVGSSAGAKAFVAILGMQRLHAGEMGAFRNEFSDPSVPRTRGGQGAAGAAGPAPSSETRPAMQPSVAPIEGRSPVATPNGGASTGNYVNPALLAPAPTPPNVIGAGAVPSSITPTPPVPAIPASPTAPAGGGLFDPGTAGPPPGAAATPGASGDPRLQTLPERAGDPMPSFQTLPERVGDPVPSFQTLSERGPLSSAPPPPLTSPMQAPGAGPLLRVRDPYGNEMQVTQRQLDNRPGGSKDLTVLGPVSAPISMAPPEQNFAALEPYMQPPSAPPIAAPEQPPSLVGADMAASPALLAAQIRSTPPWRLSPEQIQFAEQNGLMEDAMRVPGRMVA